MTATVKPNWMKVPSFKHQIEGVKRLIDHQGIYALLWDPGTGKTKTIIDYLSWLALSAQREIRVLVVCPKAVTDSWVEQGDVFSSVEIRGEVLEGTINDKIEYLSNLRDPNVGDFSPKITMMVCNLDTFSSRRTVSKTSSKLHSDALLVAVKKFAPHVLVVDESHRIKGKSSNAARLLQRVAKAVDRRILLTGTPMPHSPLDIWSQWRVLDEQCFATNGKSWSFAQFQQRYAVTGGYMGKEIKGFVHLDDLEDRMGRNSMVVRKEDALDLPPTTEVIRHFQMEPAEAKAYRSMLKDLLVKINSEEFMTAPSRLTQMLRLRQIVSGYIRVDDGDYQYIGEGRLKATLDLLEDLMATEKRVVVFAWGRPEVDRLVARINASKDLNGAKASAITGQTPDEERLLLRKKFASDSDDRQILVCQWRTVSLGVNEFVAASHAVFLSLSQQRDDLIQGKGRLDRQGQTKPVTFWYIQCPGTVDEIILQSHTDRTNLEDALLAHIRGDQDV